MLWCSWTTCVLIKRADLFLSGYFFGDKRIFCWVTHWLPVFATMDSFSLNSYAWEWPSTSSKQLTFFFGVVKFLGCFHALLGLWISFIPFIFPVMDSLRNSSFAVCCLPMIGICRWGPMLFDRAAASMAFFCSLASLSFLLWVKSHLIQISWCLASVEQCFLMGDFCRSTRLGSCGNSTGLGWQTKDTYLCGYNEIDRWER